MKHRFNPPWPRRLVLAGLWLASGWPVYADESATVDERADVGQPLDLVNGKLTVPVPGAWKEVEPRSRILDHEFSIAATSGDTPPGRLTMMRSGGGVEANIARWQGQFTPPPDADPQPDGPTEKKKIGELMVYLVDLSGTFHDRPRGPFGPAVDREAYRMLAAIVRTPDAGDYFFKFSGPQATVDEHATAFHEMIDGLQWNAP